MKFHIESERLILREFRVEDAPFFHALNADKEVMKYTGDVPFDSIQSAEDFVRGYDAYELFGYGRWTVLLKEDESPIGWCGLKWHENEGYVDLGFRFAKAFWGKGYASEAARASLDWAKANGIKQVAGRTMVENERSIRLLEKLGFSNWQKLEADLHCGQIAFLDL